MSRLVNFQPLPFVLPYPVDSPKFHINLQHKSTPTLCSVNQLHPSCFLYFFLSIILLRFFVSHGDLCWGLGISDHQKIMDTDPGKKKICHLVFLLLVATSVIARKVWVTHSRGWCQQLRQLACCSLAHWSQILNYNWDQAAAKKNSKCCIHHW